MGQNTIVNNLPSEMVPSAQKNEQWRKQHLDWATGKSFFNYSLVRKSVLHKKINYDLLQGKLHMSDLLAILNPENIEGGYLPETIQHYPIINSKLNVLQGEEMNRVFDYKAIVTNPNMISTIAEEKKQALLQDLTKLIQDSGEEEDTIKQKLQDLQQYYNYSYQDFRESRANALLNHYSKEQNFKAIFNSGFLDGCAVGEELYQCDIIGGEPTLYKLNPLKVRVFKSGFSTKIEDADIIILEDYWSISRVIDTYYDSLTVEDIKYLENLPSQPEQPNYDSMGNLDERFAYVNTTMLDENVPSELMIFDPFNETTSSIGYNMLPYDLLGNVRVIRMFWKSRRKVKKVKSYNQQTGETEYNFYTENYVIDENRGEEEEIFYINEAWEGTKIGSQIYVNMRPKLVQYNRLNNPSRCHFGIIGNIYSFNDNKPFSLVDMMKPYNYLYDVIHDRLNKTIAANWGKIIQLDISKIPQGWDPTKWLYFAKTMKVAIVDSFKEGNYGAATGKLAGALNNNSSGVIDAETGQYIMQLTQYLEYIKNEMAEVVGITRQREGQISNRETVGGVERATQQSSYITEWLFIIHDDIKRRVLECFLETAKIALKGHNKKFNYILNDTSQKIIDIPGDEFAECDYGIVVDNSNATQQLNQKLDMLVQAALQNQSLSFAEVMKLYTSMSMSEKIRMIENGENQRRQQQEDQMKQQMEQQQQQMQLIQAQKEAELKQKEDANVRDNETQLIIAQMDSKIKDRNLRDIEQANNKKEILNEKKREFDSTLNLNKQKLELDKQKLNNKK